ncbi:MAG TPA: hypothetical protein VL991_00005 [Terracidiphilus sp.]|nr:hypothetical protein [Terracidiphilus sp.]
MMGFGLSKVVQGLLLGSVVLAAGGCHKNQNAQNTAAQNPQSQSAAQPASPDNNSASAVTSPTPNNPVPSAAPASSSANTAAANPAPASTPAPAAPQSAAPAPPPAAEQQASNAQQPAAVVVPEGTVLHIRINQRISVKTSHAGDAFDGTIVNPVAVNGVEVIPAGSIARGRVVAAHKRGHFKGRSVLELTLVGLDVNGRHYRLDTGTVVRTKKGKGKRTAAFIGGGTGVGMLIGGVATGGVGLLIGGLSGAGAGTLGAAFTGNKDIDIPAETVMTFRLDQPIQLR